MSFLSVNNLRNKRISNQNNILGLSQLSISNLHTDARQTHSLQAMMEDFAPMYDKNDLKMSFGDELFINNLHLIPDPLRKNLADSLITDEPPKPKPKMEHPSNKESINHRADSYPTLSGITSFISGVFNVLTSAMFKRPQSPVDFHDCVDSDRQEMAPVSWQLASCQKKDKNVADESLNCNNTNLDKLSEPVDRTDTSNMADCKTAALQCEDKLKRVQELLSSKNVPQSTVRRTRRPKKVFVDADSIVDSFEDAFCPEDVVSNPNDTFIEYHTPLQYHIHGYCEVQSPMLMKRGAVSENTESESDIINGNVTGSEEFIHQPVEQTCEIPENMLTPPNNNTEVSEKRQVVSSCEEKLAKLKALLQNRSKETISEPEMGSPASVPIQIGDKKLRNPNRNTCHSKKSRIRRNIDEDMLFANEVALDDSSAESSPNMLADRCPFTAESLQDEPEFFDEVRGRFHSGSTTDSDDSFQIVVSDCPRRIRMPSDCESEDSFIVFEDTPDSCFTSNDVFDDSDSDEESGLSDSGCMTSLSHALTRTVTNLTEDCLYDDRCTDEVDYAFEGGQNVDPGSCEDDKNALDDGKNTGVLLTVSKKLLKKNQPERKVTFSTQPPKVHVMRVWAFAAKQARIGNWESCARDRDRFKRRIADVDMAVSWVLKPQHRSRIVFQRFMPWWNAEKRRELAEKKMREDELKGVDASKEVSDVRVTDEVTGIEGPAEDIVTDSRIVDDIKLDVDPNFKTGRIGNAFKVDVDSLDIFTNGDKVTDIKIVDDIKLDVNENFKTDNIGNDFKVDGVDSLAIITDGDNHVGIGRYGTTVSVRERSVCNDEGETSSHFDKYSKDTTNIDVSRV